MPSNDVAIGLFLPMRDSLVADPELVGPFARHAEASGYDELAAVEHAVVVSGYADAYPYARSGRMPLPDDAAIPDPLDLLSFLAGVTTRIGLSTGVLVAPNHHPVVLAKRVATVDRLSGGRLRLAVGVGWMREEIEACGAAFETRGRRTDETIDAMRALWQAGEAGADFDGEFFRFARAHSYPRPVRPEGVPIHIGGHSPAAARRSGRRGDGFQPLGLSGDDLTDRVALMRREAESAGRDPDRLELTLGGALAGATPESVQAAAAVGAARLILSPTPTSDHTALHDEVSAAAERLGL